jgi:hypothetical protein
VWASRSRVLLSATAATGLLPPLLSWPGGLLVSSATRSGSWKEPVGTNSGRGLPADGAWHKPVRQPDRFGTSAPWGPSPAGSGADGPARCGATAVHWASQELTDWLAGAMPPSTRSSQVWSSGGSSRRSACAFFSPSACSAHSAHA